MADPQNKGCISILFYLDHGGRHLSVVRLSTFIWHLYIISDRQYFGAETETVDKIIMLTLAWGGIKLARLGGFAWASSPKLAVIWGTHDWHITATVVPQHGHYYYLTDYTRLHLKNKFQKIWSHTHKTRSQVIWSKLVVTCKGMKGENMFILHIFKK